MRATLHGDRAACLSHALTHCAALQGAEPTVREQTFAAARAAIEQLAASGAGGSGGTTDVGGVAAKALLVRVLTEKLGGGAKS